VAGDDADRCDVQAVHGDEVQRAQAQLLDGASAARLAELFKALSDPTRVRILSALAAGELCVCDVAAALGMSQSAISHQLRVLRQLRLVRRRKDGQMAFYTLDDEHVSDLFRQSLENVLHP
jgi:DNA-binding transcriptional ArsR family regulator